MNVSFFVFLTPPLPPDSYCSSSSTLYSHQWNRNPNTKIDLKEINGVSVHPATHLLFFFFNDLISHNMMLFVLFCFRFHIMSKRTDLLKSGRGRGRVGGGLGSVCTVGVLFLEYTLTCGTPAGMMG